MVRVAGGAASADVAAPRSPTGGAADQRDVDHATAVSVAASGREPGRASESGHARRSATSAAAGSAGGAVMAARARTGDGRHRCVPRLEAGGSRWPRQRLVEDGCISATCWTAAAGALRWTSGSACVPPGPGPHARPRAARVPSPGRRVHRRCARGPAAARIGLRAAGCRPASSPEPLDADARIGPERRPQVADLAPLGSSDGWRDRLLHAVPPPRERRLRRSNDQRSVGMARADA